MAEKEKYLKIKDIFGSDYEKVLEAVGIWDPEDSSTLLGKVLTKILLVLSGDISG